MTMENKNSGKNHEGILKVYKRDVDNGKKKNGGSTEHPDQAPFLVVL